MRLFKRGIGILLFVLASCQVEENKVRIPLYFDVNGLVEKQMAFLQAKKAAVKKDITINSAQEAARFAKVDWTKELSVFKEVDINAPILRDMYSMEKKENEDGHSLIYTPREVKKKGVARLEVVMDGDGKVKAIYSKIISENLLYSSTRQLWMNFSQATLHSYKIRNVQDVIFKDPVEITVSSEIEGIK